MSERPLPDILIVEDTAALAKLYREYLKTEKVTVRNAATGSEAEALIAERSPDVLLLDLNLPDMNGLDILKRLQKAGSDIITVVITAHGSVNVAVDAMRAGAYDFLLKPLSAERLLVTIRNVLERRP